MNRTDYRTACLFAIGAGLAALLEGCGSPGGAVAKGIGCELARIACAVCDAKTSGGSSSSSSSGSPASTDTP